MANIRNLKKDINYVLGDIIENVYLWESENGGKRTKESEAIIDEAINVFDDLIVKVNNKDADNKKKHFKAIQEELETKGTQLIERLNKLS